MKKANVRTAKYANKNAKSETLEIGDAVFYLNHKRESKLSPKWLPNFIIIKQTGPLSFRIKNQLTGYVSKAHRDHLRLAPLDWDSIKSKSSQEEENTEKRQTRGATLIFNNSSESETDYNNLLISRHRQARMSSSEEDNIPLAEMRKIWSKRKRRAKSGYSSDEEDSDNSN